MVIKKKNKFNYLLNLELWNSLKIVIPSIIILMVIRAGMFANSVYWRIRPLYSEFKGNITEFISTYGHIKIPEIYGTDISILLISFSITIGFLIFYVIFIWLKEWLGNNKTIYTLLELPISRTLIVLSKLVTCFIVFIMFVASQVISLLIDRVIFYIMIPKEIAIYESFMTTISNNRIPFIMFTNSYLEMLLIMLMALAGISSMFVIILLDRSYGWKGILVTLIFFAVISGGSYFIAQKLSLFANELLILNIVVNIVLIVGCFMLSKYLLEKKVHV